MPSFPPRRRRARPVADAPIDGLLPRTPELAKAWLLARIEQAPLHRAPLLVGAGVVDEGPQLCDAVLRAPAGCHCRCSWPRWRTPNASAPPRARLRPQLIEAAEEARFAASASGTGVAR